MTTRARGALASLAVLVAIGSACAPPPGGGGGPVVLSSGHADAVEVSLDGLALRLLIEDETSGGVTYRDPAQTVLQVLPGAQTTVPANPAFAFLGSPGTTIWTLPQTQNPNLLWPGSSTERIGPGELQGNTVTWSIQSVNGPGAMHVYTVGPFGTPTVLFSTNSSFPQSTTLGVPTHSHYNISFGATGTYSVVMRASATLSNGTAVSSPNTTYTFRVGPL